MTRRLVRPGQSRIGTTVVGSYPIPTWLAALPSAPNLADALLVVLKTHELAGVDLLADRKLHALVAGRHRFEGRVGQVPGFGAPTDA